MSYETEELKTWKKVFESDLTAVVPEMEGLIEKPSVILLTGELGAGKTTICKKLAKDDHLQSTSYSLVAEKSGVVYADLYRLKNETEIDELELDLYLENKYYFLCEWGKKYLPELYRICGDEKHYYELVISINDGNENSSRNYQLNRFLDFS